MARHDGDITELLRRWWRGDDDALQELFSLVHADLRRVADQHFRSERAGHTLQPTALVNEAYLRFSRSLPPRLNDRAHFFAVAARLMRQILVEHARRRGAAKRGGSAVTVALNEALDRAQERGEDLVALDDALKTLDRLDPRKCRVIELRFFGGLSLEETAQVLGVSSTTVVEEAKLARAWLYRELARGSAGGEAPRAR